MKLINHNTTAAGVTRRIGMAFAVALLLGLGGVGCVSQRAGLEIPSEARVVGGGLVIEFEADANGILFLVDQRHLVSSQTIKKGEIYKINGSVEVGDGTTVDLVEARLYFVSDPASTAGTRPPSAKPAARPASPSPDPDPRPVDPALDLGGKNDTDDPNDQIRELGDVLGSAEDAPDDLQK